MSSVQWVPDHEAMMLQYRRAAMEDEKVMAWSAAMTTAHGIALALQIAGSTHPIGAVFTAAGWLIGTKVIWGSTTVIEKIRKIEAVRDRLLSQGVGMDAATYAAIRMQQENEAIAPTPEQAKNIFEIHKKSLQKPNEPKKINMQQDVQDVHNSKQTPLSQ